MAQLSVIVMCRSERPPPDPMCCLASSATKSSATQKSGLVNPVERDMRQDEIDAAFREMGVNAPIPKDKARLALATDAARRALAGETNVFNEATHIRIHICGLHDAPPELQPIVDLSVKSEHAPSWQWNRLERQLRDAMTKFLNTPE